MKAKISTRVSYDRKGNIVSEQHEERELNEEQREAICALIMDAFLKRYISKEA